MSSPPTGLPIENVSNIVLGEGGIAVSGNIWVRAGDGTGVKLSSEPQWITPTILSSNSIDNYNPGAGDIIRISTISTGNYVLTGMVPLDEIIRTIINVGVSGTVVLQHQSISSSEANRFITNNGSNFSIPPSGSSARLLYDPVSLRWRVFS